jgi:hypothetical protein
LNSNEKKDIKPTGDNSISYQNANNADQKSLEVEPDNLRWNVEGEVRDLIREEMTFPRQSSEYADMAITIPERISRVSAEEQREQEINPFQFQPKARSSEYLQAFLRLNEVFYFFDDEALIGNFELAYAANAHLPGRIKAELCLALAIGGQWLDSGNDDYCLMWYENGRRYVDDEAWDHDTWVMRAMALICMYHMSARPDTAQHYLRK